VTGGTGRVAQGGWRMTGEVVFGHARLADFALEPATLHLNHGSFGATPLIVRAAQDRWRARMEANTTRFFSVEIGPALRAAAERAATSLGGAGTDWVFVDNATTAVNAVLAGLDFAPGEEIVTTAHVYPAVRRILRRAAQRAGARVVEVALPCPIPDEETIVAAVAAALGPRTRLAVLDHVTSETATVFPIARLAAIFRAAGVPVLVDGAHAPGMLALDAPAIGADWYTGNAHKWLFAPKGCALLWTAPARQAATRPLVVSHGYDDGYTAAFDWTGTRDPSAWLALPAALDYVAGLGAAAMRQWNQALARAAGAMLADRLGTAIACPPAMLGAMASVRLPVAVEASEANAWALRGWLRASHGIEAPAVAVGGALWIRISAQVYTERSDFDRLADALATLA